MSEEQALPVEQATEQKINADVILMTATTPDGNILYEMQFPKGEPDLKNPAQHMGLWLHQNWEMIHKMFLVAYTKFHEQEANVTDVEPKEIATPQKLTLVAADGESLVQQ